MDINDDDSKSFWWDHDGLFSAEELELLTYFPEEPFNVLPSNLAEEQFGCKLVYDHIDRWMSDFVNSGESAKLVDVVKQHLHSNRNDSFLFSALFFEVTCFLQTQRIKTLNSGLSDEGRLERPSQFFASLRKIKSDRLSVQETILGWVEHGFSSQIYADLQQEMDRFEESVVLYTRFYPSKSKAAVFAINSYKPLTAGRLTPKAIHHAAFSYNIRMLFSLCFPDLSLQEIDLLIFYFWPSKDRPSVLPSSIKKRSEDAARSGHLGRWFYGRYKTLLQKIRAGSRGFTTNSSCLQTFAQGLSHLSDRKS